MRTPGSPLHPLVEVPLDIGQYLHDRGEAVESWLRLYTPRPLEPLSVHESVRYSVFSGGKRIRPILAGAVCEMLGGSLACLAPLATAVEWVHTYSLIHDDLPCMDNDDMRRGMPTNHRVYGEAVALLAGDALLTGAFGLIASAGSEDILNSGQRVDAIRILAQAAGLGGMVGGQVMDMEAEGSGLSREELDELHSRKTGALIRAAAAMGVVAAGASRDVAGCVDDYARHLGVAFQIVDDVLDVTADQQLLGKPIGSDARNRKSTYVSLYGIEGAMAVAMERVLAACRSVEAFGELAAPLVHLAYYVTSRRS